MDSEFSLKPNQEFSQTKVKSGKGSILSVKPTFKYFLKINTYLRQDFGIFITDSKNLTFSYK